MTGTPSTPFRAEMVRELKRIRRECERDGIDAMGLDNVFQLMRFDNVPSAPRGTNAGYMVKQELRDLAATREFAGFILT